MDRFDLFVAGVPWTSILESSVRENLKSRSRQRQYSVQLDGPCSGDIDGNSWILSASKLLEAGRTFFEHKRSYFEQNHAGTMHVGQVSRILVFIISSPTPA